MKKSLLSVLVLGLLASSPLSIAAQTLAITHVQLIDVLDGTIRRDQTLVIRANRIASVSASTAHPAHADRIVDGHGAYVIPGLWDMHTHVYFDHTAAEGDDLILPSFLLNGVTGIRDMGSELDPVLRGRSEIAAHHLLGPRMVVSGPMLDGPKSQYKAAIPVATPEDGRNAVDMLKRRGVDFIKVQSGVPRDAYFAIADEAKRVGLPFEGHVPDAIRASEAVSAGQRTFEHLIGIFEASTPNETAFLTGPKSPGLFLQGYDPLLEARIIALLAKAQIWQCPTLFWERGQWLVDVIDYHLDPDLSFAAHTWVTQLWPASQKAIAASLDTDPVAVRERFVQHELDLVRKLHTAGVPFLAGTDTPAGVDVLPGISLHLELQRLVAAGFTPLEALQTATLNPQLFYHPSEKAGRIKAGDLADLVLLQANPLQDIANTRSVVGVLHDGAYLSKEDLDGMKTQLKHIAATR